MDKIAVTLEALHTHTHKYFTTKERRYDLLFKRISYLFKTSCKGGYKLVGGLYG